MEIVIRGGVFSPFLFLSSPSAFLPLHLCALHGIYLK